MLSGMASLFFGNAAKEVTIDQTQESQQVDLDTTDAGQGWVLVDVSASGSVAHLEENPMENLFIEHPSMSVYNAGCGDGAEPGINQEAVVDVLPFNQQHGVAVQQAQQHTRSLSTYSGVEQTKLSRFHQRQQHKALGKEFNKKCLERSNKSLFQNSCRKQRSSLKRALWPSGCMSGRRSQRSH